MKIRDLDLEIVKGNITTLDVDAVVRVLDQGLQMHLEILEEKEPGLKGNSIQSEEVFWTKTDGLKAKYLIQVAVDGENLKEQEIAIRKACADALRCAAELELKSIALPALGCDGTGDFPVVGAAKIMTQEVLKLARVQTNPLKKITFCSADEKISQTFLTTVRGYVDHLRDDLGSGPYVTVDAVIALEEGIILIERSNPPYGWALPGGFVDCGESLETAVKREAKEETDMDLVNIKQLMTYSDPGRDPRFHTVSTVFVAQGQGIPQFGDDAKGLKIVKYEDLLKLDYAFDHKQVIQDYLKDKNKEV